MSAVVAAAAWWTRRATRAYLTRPLRLVDRWQLWAAGNYEIALLRHRDREAR